MFIQSLTIDEPCHDQKMSVIRKWTDAHQLKEFRGQWYKEQKQIVKEFDDPPTAGHPGIVWTKDLIT